VSGERGAILFGCHLEIKRIQAIEISVAGAIIQSGAGFVFIINRLVFCVSVLRVIVSHS